MADFRDSFSQRAFVHKDINRVPCAPPIAQTKLSIKPRRKPYISVSLLSRLPLLLAFLGILALLATCGSGAEPDIPEVEPSDRATPASAGDEKQSTARPTATRTAQETSTLPGTDVPTPPLVSSGSTRVETTIPVPSSVPQSTPAATLVPTAVVPKAPSTPAPIGTPAATQSPPGRGTSEQADREALVALYSATSGRFWATGRNENWLTGALLSEWHGVSTCRNGRVIALNLPEAGLIGEIPPELSDLDLLMSLVLFGNQLTGEVPQGLFDLPYLEEFRIWGGNNLVHPDRVALQALYDPTGGDGWRNKWETLEGYLRFLPGVLTNDMYRVTELDQWGSYLRGQLPPEIGNLTYLTKLDLTQNQLTGSIPPEIGNLANLKELHL